MKAKFTGSNASGYVDYWGYHFPCGEVVTINSEEAIAGVRQHPEFSFVKDEKPPSVGSAKPPAPKAPAKAKKRTG